MPPDPDRPCPGDTAILDQILLGGGAGSRQYTFGPAGHLTQVDAGANQILFTHDAEGRLSRLTRPAAGTQVDLAYDGRSFLRHSAAPSTIFRDGFETGDLGCWSSSSEGGAGGGGPGCLAAAPAPQTEPIYSSEGLLYSLRKRPSSGGPDTFDHVFTFAGRPVAQLRIDAGTSTWTYLTTDHLGTPVLASNSGGALLWSGGFEPFGADWQAGSPAGAQERGIFLRLPGQWDDDTWQQAALGAGVYYNLHRWYQDNVGRYTSRDRLDASPNDFAYVDARPLVLLDPSGLLALDPGTCRAFKTLPGPSGSGCCLGSLGDAVRQFNEFFSRGWRNRHPKCWNILASVRWKPREGGGLLTPLSCMWGAAHSDKVVKCDATYSGAYCAETSETGSSTLYPLICNTKRCGTPLNIVFHEQLHACGAPAENAGQNNEARDLANICVGGDKALQP